MMAMLKIAILLLVVFTATALENSHEIDSIHELHPYYTSPAPSPSTYVDEHNKATIICDIVCATKCRNQKPWSRVYCIAACLVACTSASNSISEIDCAVDCAQSSTNNLRYDANMMDDRISACYQQCKKD